MITVQRAMPRKSSYAPTAKVPSAMASVVLPLAIFSALHGAHVPGATMFRIIHLVPTGLFMIHTVIVGPSIDPPEQGL